MAWHSKNRKTPILEMNTVNALSFIVLFYVWLSLVVPEHDARQNENERKILPLVRR